MIEAIQEWLTGTLGMSSEVQLKILNTILVLILVWLFHWIIQWTLVRRIPSQRARFQWQKVITYIFFGLTVVLVWPIWFEGLRSVATYLGLLSAGLAVALKDPITDLIGWVFILWRKPFEVGDRIQIGAYTGDVVDQRIFQFSMMEVGNWVDADQSTGRILHVPNGQVFTNVLANYTKGSSYIWNEIPVLITFESDWEKAKEILQEIASDHSSEVKTVAEQSFREAARRYMIQYGALTSTVYTSVKDSGVLLTIRYLCEPRRRRDTTQKIWESILLAFARYPNINLAYPTMRRINSVMETSAEQDQTAATRDYERQE